MVEIVTDLQADLDIDEAFEWYRQRDAKAASRFLAALETKFNFIRQFPRLGSPLDRRHRFVKVPRFPFYIVYRFQTKAIRVIAVVHQSRRPGYWRRR